MNTNIHFNVYAGDKRLDGPVAEKPGSQLPGMRLRSPTARRPVGWGGGGLVQTHRLTALSAVGSGSIVPAV